MKELLPNIVDWMTESLGTFLEFSRENRTAVVAVVVLSGSIIAVTWQLFSGPEQFPADSGSPIQIASPSVLKQILPEAPNTPSIPGIVINESVRVPGLESVGWTKSPSMTADLLVIVFIGFSPGGSGDDVWMATRNSVDDPFSDASPIRNVNSDAKETHPSLTPDGLELSFIRLNEPKQWCVATRKARSDDFSSPTAVQTGDMIEEPFQIDFVQQITQDRGILSIRNSDLTISKCFFYRRSGARLAEIQEIRIANPWPRFFFSGNQDRVYFSSSEGVYVSARANRESAFVLPEMLVAKETTGGDASRFDSSIWLSPQEDILVYSRSDPDAPDDNPLWLMRLR